MLGDRQSISRIRRASLAFAATWVVALPAFAHPTNEDLAQRFAKGSYMEAARMAELAAGADDYAFAARSLLAECMTGASEPDARMVERARQDAEIALKLDPKHEEARLQLAIALSLKSRTMNSVDVWNSGYGDKGLKLARSVLAQDPDNSFAHGFLAVWNLEVRRRGGTLGASMMGASLADARRHYDEAVRLAPDYVGVYWQYARALVALDARKYGDQARAILQKALEAKADDHCESVMQDRAKVLLEALKGDRKAAQALALRML